MNKNLRIFWKKPWGPATLMLVLMGICGGILYLISRHNRACGITGLVIGTIIFALIADKLERNTPQKFISQ